MEKRIILLDLNYTLCANSHEKRFQVGTYAEKIAAETYRQWLVDLVREHHVILLTCRPIWHKEQTLARIRDLTGWQPQEALFCWKKGFKPEQWKKWALENIIYPKHGTERSRYFAIESNQNTHRMYDAQGIAWAKVYKGDRWTELPFGQKPIQERLL